MLGSMWNLQGYDDTAAEVHHGYGYADRDAGRRARSPSGSVRSYGHGDRRRKSPWGASPQRDTGSRRSGYGDEAEFEVSSRRFGYGDQREGQTRKTLSMSRPF
jgi:hypothetical protein